MNLVGKIFVVLIFVMSLVFMSFAVAVYATHKNWKDVVTTTREEATREKPLGLMYQLEDTRTRNQELKDQRDKLQQDVDAEKAAAIQVRSKLETERDLLKQELQEKEQSLAKHIEAQREAVAAMNATQANLDRLDKRVKVLEGDIDQAHHDRDAHFKQVVKLTDELHQAVNELKRLKARQITLVADLAKAENVLRHFGRTKDENISGEPPQVDGVVLATPRPDLIEISIGSDDGLLKGHRLEVVRLTGGARTYVGRIEVVRTYPDKAVCRIIPEFRKSQTQRGDRVVSKIQ